MNRAANAVERGGRLAAVPLALMAAIVACSSPPDEPSAIGADDQRQLNAAAAMLDSNSVDAGVANDHESSAHD